MQTRKYLYLCFILILISTKLEAQQKIYWISIGQSSSSILRANLDGSNQETIVNSDAQSYPYFLAIDDVESKLYWTSVLPRRVMRSNLDGSSIEIVSQDINEPPIPYQISVDPVSRQVFWTDVNDARSLRKINLDLTGKDSRGNRFQTITTAPALGQVIFTDVFDGSLYSLSASNISANPVTLLSQPGPITSINILHSSNTMIWYLPQLSIIRKSSILAPSSNLLATLNSTTHSPRIITADRDENFLYWTDGAANAIVRMPVDTNPASPELLSLINTNNPSGLAISCGFFAPDSDTDGFKDCDEECPADPLKNLAGNCGCGKSESADDIDEDGVLDCISPFRILAKDTKITDAPIITINDRTIKVLLEKFVKAVFKKKKGKTFTAKLSAAKGPKVTYRYVVSLKYKSAKIRDLRTINTKRNELTIKNLKPGNYSLNYRAEILEGGKVVARTNKSPSAEFTIE